MKAAAPGGTAVRVALLVTTGLLLLLWALELSVAVRYGAVGEPRDYVLYMDVTKRWLDGGPFYQPYQLAGPYEIGDGDVLYPPSALVLFVPATLLPGPLWWVIPLAITGWVVWSYRPKLWGWVAILACYSLFFASSAITILGTPTIWIQAFVALGVRYGWPAALVFLKPSLAPFTLIGIRDRRWWLLTAGLCVVSLALLPMWFDYLQVLGNARGPRASLLYSLNDVPLMLVPIIASVAQERAQQADDGLRRLGRLRRGRGSQSVVRPEAVDVVGDARVV